MQFAPTWDLFILVFFSIIVAYSFIIGRNATLKIIIATYLAILTADGIGNIIQKFFFSDVSIIRGMSADVGNLIALKILAFVIAIVLVTIRGGFVVEIGREHSVLMSLATTAAFGFLSAGLIVSTILIYISGGSFVGVIGPGGLDIAGMSYLAQVMTANYSFWFAMPAIAFIVASFVGEEGGSLHGEED